MKPFHGSSFISYLRPMPIDPVQLVLLCLASFLAGMVDAIVGGGGLIQTPAALMLLPSYPVASVLATTKIPSFSGTLIATSQLVKKVKVRIRFIAMAAVIAFFASLAGSEVLTRVSNSFMKQILLIVLIAVAVYTFIKKDFGQKSGPPLPHKKELVTVGCFSAVIGFYDGFIGPGTGSFLILAFITLLRFDFLQASTHAKLVNLATNLGSITLFLFHGSIIWFAALPMAAANALGGYVGARVAIARGNRFIRVFFPLIITATLIRFLFDVF